ncbi:MULTISPECIES: ATP-dependent sacrificial sulfur transferase LarE [unclassified Clostridioides]|uniref:ATP-dependent sacrificial sulfur transferase LarE n=1 Tax=unclassified Clostridioides TaxID=2635829 RepID=UPI001D0C1C1A|nr:ATP-dependent sacrificial sulfur transferase LarE [Clostridioides sp. ES-S-0001-02]MCC0639844.1 ATP-dependent sacrificial sulfur transferase LarE [Clostridioides sp. ES-S-0049-03]MCC0674879.1 ATP-dependent sacrificial sulfur transferase LarE [Clostridioides sp. ES-W-0018-02]MCC0702432.1 ATP-dependent sacrificial sulfur transferase LarE [Clostridioides sp. ES-S-0049-02]MCC0706938.1 ATP-dependent sacrificial sulfur transferase LarE [Clostridioides sp. ES-S-0190-01]MCC0710306.1 ATP-dependent s
MEVDLVKEREKLEKLREKLIGLESVAVAYSGGVDSNFLLKVARDTLGDNVIAVTIHAMMHSNREIEEAKQYTKNFGVKHIILKIEDFDLKEFKENGVERCYYCKKYIFTKIKEVAKEHNIKYIVDGTNVDDLGDYRPGLKALNELEVISPLKESGLKKNEIRLLSRDMKLETFNKPSFACLASRIPYGVEITDEKLRIIEKSEEYLSDLGFSQFRVRMHGDIARIEVNQEELGKFFENNNFSKVDTKLKKFGFKYVTLDMSGYQMGSMNLNM